eukprot:Pgem_evm1s1988
MTKPDNNTTITTDRERLQELQNKIKEKKKQPTPPNRNLNAVKHKSISLDTLSTRVKTSREELEFQGKLNNSFFSNPSITNNNNDPNSNERKHDFSKIKRPETKHTETSDSGVKNHGHSSKRLSIGILSIARKRSQSLISNNNSNYGGVDVDHDDSDCMDFNTYMKKKKEGSKVKFKDSQEMDEQNNNDDSPNPALTRQRSSSLADVRKIKVTQPRPRSQTNLSVQKARSMARRQSDTRRTAWKRTSHSDSGDFSEPIDNINNCSLGENENGDVVYEDANFVPTILNNYRSSYSNNDSNDHNNNDDEPIYEDADELVSRLQSLDISKQQKSKSQPSVKRNSMLKSLL